MQQDNSTALLDFVEATKSKGASDEFLVSLLAHQGWPKDEVFNALGTHWEHVTGTTIPKRAGHGESSREAFMYLLSFGTLATWTSALGVMFFRFIEQWFPDPVAGVYDNVRASVTWQMASLIVAFPVFVLVMRQILADVYARPESLQSPIRKWLTYIALLLTAGGIVSDLICVLDYTLAGELTIRFILKAATVLAICAPLFLYYLDSLRWGNDPTAYKEQAKRKTLQFGLGSLAVVLLAFCLGLNIAGLPTSQRNLQADTKRVQDLRAIAAAVHFWNTRALAATPTSNRLPDSIGQLIGKGITQSQASDPESKSAYEYRPVALDSYELCATFSAPAEDRQLPQTQTWYHGKGRTCFTLEARALPAW